MTIFLQLELYIFFSNYHVACITAAAYFYLVQCLDKILQRVKVQFFSASLTALASSSSWCLIRVCNFHFYKGLHFSCMHSLPDSISMTSKVRANLIYLEECQITEY